MPEPAGPLGDQRSVDPERARLARATRALVAALLESPDAAAEQLRAVATSIEAATADLASGARSPERVRHHDDYLPRSPLVGAVNPVAPPLEYSATVDGVTARGVFGAAYEGPPGYVHGGWIALAFDEVLGMTNIASGHPGMTARLSVRYRRPTPLHTELRIEGHTTRVEGRRITTLGRMHAGDVVTAEAEGMFVQLGAERALEYFGEPAVTEEPIDPLP